MWYCLKRKSLLCFLWFFIGSTGYLSLFAQVTFGMPSYDERHFEEYSKDTTASAVYLYEYGNNYFDIRDNYIWLITEYHAKIKILKPEGFEHATIKIPTYKGEKRSEKVKKLKAVTHNKNVKHVVQSQNIYNSDVSEKWSETRFTFSDVKVGSILEYTYEIQSPFHFNLSGWDFQSEIPKLYTEYNARIPGNWKYNRTLIGSIPLDVNEASIKKDCFYIVGYGIADCEILKYSMTDVPAFKDSESFMLSGHNYRSRLEFELSEYHNLKGFTEKFTKSWKDVDKEFKKDEDLGRQLRKKNFFENNFPQELLEIGDELERATAIYKFAQIHFNWNSEYGIWRDNNVKKAFENKAGSAAEINIALINLLNTAGIKANMMLLGTRERGLPKRNHPVMSDFNYVVAKADINGTSYLLDATEKELPFGVLPFRCLNYYGRVMDFESESYWFDIEPNADNKKQYRAMMELNPEDGTVQGKLNAVSTGYAAISERKKMNQSSEDEYLDLLSEKISSTFYYTSHEVLKDKSNDKRLMQQFNFEIENVLQGDKIYINPNIIKFFPSNPFTSNERYYPVDFGYQRNYTFNLNLKVPEGYQINTLPTNQNLALPGNMGVLRFQCQGSSNTISVLFVLKMNATHFKSEFYSYLKEFFKRAVDVQNNSFIVLERV